LANPNNGGMNTSPAPPGHIPPRPGSSSSAAALAASKPRAPAGARRIARRQADGPHRCSPPPAPPGWAVHPAVPLPLLGQSGHHRPQLGRGGPQLARRAGAVFRLRCLAVLAVCARVFPDRLSQPAGGAAQASPGR